jgi:hypothetical protein
MARNGMLATPTARDWRSGQKVVDKVDRNGGETLADQFKGLLNPEFVGWMMDFPPLWSLAGPPPDTIS